MQQVSYFYEKMPGILSGHLTDLNLSIHIRLPLLSSRAFILTLLFSIGLICRSNGQEILWAGKLLGFSSEYRPGPYGRQYRADQLLGQPEKFPYTGDSPNAWSPAEADGNSEEWVKVGFSRAISPRQVLVFENFNPGALVAVYLYEPSGKEHLAASREQLKGNGEPGRLLTLKPNLPPDVRINALKLVMNPSLVSGYNQIDAIGITGSDSPVHIGVEVAGDLPPGMVKTPLGSGINSKGREIAPVISPDGSTLYFTREHPENIGNARRQDVWVSFKQSNGDWGPAENMGPPINNAGDNAVLGISASGKTLYLLNAYQEDGSMVEGFSRSFLTKSGWSFPASFQIEDHYNDQRPKNTEITISPSENVIILSVQRRDTYGSKDLYVSFKKTAALWTVPLNLGPVINTADYEGAPFLAADNKTLYFTSAGHRGYGSGDIFVSRRLDDTWLNWSKPLNLGPAINSPGWDSFFTIPASGGYAYMSSFNPANQSDDLFRIPLYPSISPQVLLALNGKLTDKETGAPIAGRVELVTADRSQTIADAAPETETGDYRLLMPYDSTLVLSAAARGYFPYYEELKIPRSADLTATRNIALTPVKSGRRLPLSQVRFAQSSARLEAGSQHELMTLVELMNEYPGMEILLEGHTDNQGDFNKNLALSEERVKNVKLFLESKGIGPERIRIKAWGSSRPVTHNLTEDSRSQNRRVELTVLKI